MTALAPSLAHARRHARPAAGLSRSDTVWLVVTAAACSGWTAVVLAGYLGYSLQAKEIKEVVLLTVAAASLLAVLLWRPHAPPAVKLVFGWSWTVLLATEGAKLIIGQPIAGLAPLVVAIGGVVVARRPVEAIGVALFLAGAYGSITAFTVSPTAGADLVLAGAWVALLWFWFTGRRELPQAIPLALGILASYLAITLLMSFLVEERTQGLYSFRSSAWFMAAAIVVAYTLAADDRWERARRVALVVGALIGAYTMLRWAIGPAGDEEDAVRGTGGVFVVTGDELRLFGPLPGPQALAVWSSVMLPFSLASALSPMSPRWRLLAVAVCAMAGLALLGADSRAPIMATGAAVVVVLMLFALGHGFSGRRTAPLAIAGVLAVGGGAAFIAAGLSGDDADVQRFRGLFNPLQEFSVQDRFVKWNTILDEVDDRPFGRGMGASGVAETRYARFSSAASLDPDSSFVKVAYDQGFSIMLLFAAIFVALAVDLARRSVTAVDPAAGSVAVGGCAVVVAYAIDNAAAVYFESLLSLTPWILIGIAFAPFVVQAGKRRGRAARSRSLQKAGFGAAGRSPRETLSP